MPPRLSVRLPGQTGWLRIGGEFQNSEFQQRVGTLEASSNLFHWRTVAVLLHAPFEYEDPNWTAFAPRFYRLGVADVTATNDWANQVRLVGDPLFREVDCNSGDHLRWVKFAILLDEPYKVYFQDSDEFLLHYDFAVNRLPGFSEMTPEEFNSVSLHAQDQQVILGAVLSPLDLFLPSQEYGIQFVGLDPYPPELVASLFKLVRSAVVADPAARAFYVPAFEQTESARQNEAFFAGQGIEIASAERWLQTQTVVYSPGWAVGILKFVPAGEINAAYADGRLGPDDILLTDGVPAEVPYVSGIISLAPATPNSHVVILSRSYGIPFGYVADDGEQARLLALAGREVAFRTGAWLSEGRITVLDIDGALDPALRESILALKQPVPLEITPKAAFGAFSAPVINLVPEDIRFFGGKASNYGLLRRTIPEHSLDAIAFSFDLWDAFLEQTLSGGLTLQETIQAVLGGYTYPPDIASLRTDLAAVRNLITKTARFSDAQKAAILGALVGFDSTRNIRFRSSTNVEDTQRFTGAGLYDSYSGCVEDDLDGDNEGPSICDPTEDEERGVFRALQKVYASFYNENAFLERLRHQVNEADVGMAVLVHHSTPDPIELANGVATLAIRRTGSSPSSVGQLVTQAGAVPVANPDGSARPEVIEFWVSSFTTNLTRMESSSLVPLGTQVLAWPDDYYLLVTLLHRVAVAYMAFDTNRTEFQLDFECKKVVPGHLEVKQVRELPPPGSTNQFPTFLLNQPAEFYVSGDVFAVHRLKSRWQLSTTNIVLDPPRLATPFYTTAHVEFVEGAVPPALDGSPATWPNASHTFASNAYANEWTVFDGWSFGSGAVRRDFTLTTDIRRSASWQECPLLVLSDARLSLGVHYATAVPRLGPLGGTEWATNEVVQLYPCPWSGITNPPVMVVFANGGLSVTTTQRMAQVRGMSSVPFWGNPACGYFGPGVIYEFVSLDGETRIEGLLSQPLALRSDASQTLRHHGRTGHENVVELICDPWLEPGLTPQQTSELTAANVRLIHFYRYSFGDSQQKIHILGLDGLFRAYP